MPNNNISTNADTYHSEDQKDNVSLFWQCTSMIMNLPWKTIFFLSLVGSAYGMQKKNYEIEVLNDEVVRSICTSEDLLIYNRAADLRFYGGGGKVDFPDCLNEEARNCVEEINACESSVSKYPSDQRIKLFNTCAANLTLCKNDTSRKCLRDRRKNFNHKNSAHIQNKMLRAEEVRQKIEARVSQWESKHQNKIAALKSTLSEPAQQLFEQNLYIFKTTLGATLYARENTLDGENCGGHARHALYKLLKHQEANNTDYTFDLVFINSENNSHLNDKTHDYLMINNPKNSFMGEGVNTLVQIAKQTTGVFCDTWHRFFGTKEDDITGYYGPYAGWSQYGKIRIGFNVEEIKQLGKDCFNFFCKAYKEADIPVEIPNECEESYAPKIKQDL